MSVRYEDAGVHLAAAEEITGRITERLGAKLFGGFVPVSALKEYESPVLVSSIDGIGTKVRLAARLGRLRGLGRDIVHHCVNDIAVHGASPLFFLDYLAFNRLEGDWVEQIVDSIAGACADLGIVLAGGETAEMPLVYPPGHFDVAGAVVGAVEQAEIVDGRSIAAGDILIGLPSSGLHTNGYSLVQQVFADDDYGRYVPELGRTLGEELLEPHRCYLDEIRALLQMPAMESRASSAVDGGGAASDAGNRERPAGRDTYARVHGLAHITGGGIAGNLSRILPPGLQAAVELPSPPPLFAQLEDRGIARDEMLRVFNMGIGMIAVCDPSILPSIDWSRFRYLGTVHETDDPHLTLPERSVIFRDTD